MTAVAPQPSGAQGAAAHPPVLKKRKYRPLDVKTWHEGSLRMIAWILVIVFAVVSAGVWVIYELMVLNWHDRDFRDTYFDQRITNDVNNRYHKNYLLAENCCNLDPINFPYSCDDYVPDYYDPGPPYCKPIIMMECTDIDSAACNSTRSALYRSVGLTSGGQYENCLLAGRVRVGAQAVAAGRPITLVPYFRQAPMADTLVISNPFDIDQATVDAFVDRVARSVNASDVAYVQPAQKLSSSVFLNGDQAWLFLSLLRGSSRGVRAPPPWNKVSNLWPWPGMNKRCQNSAVAAAYYLTGSVYTTLPRFKLDAPDKNLVVLQVANDTLLLPAWNVTMVDADDEANGSDRVNVSMLSAVTVFTGMAAPLGACWGWRLSGDPLDVHLNWTTVWTGNISDLQRGLAFGPASAWIPISVRDVAGPRPISLYFYGGLWYIWYAFLMAFIWLVATSLMVLTIPLVWWNIRSNKGLPPIIYRYMRKYRGW